MWLFCIAANKGESSFNQILFRIICEFVIERNNMHKIILLQ